MYERLKAVM